jgi:hypothetical protein
MTILDNSYLTIEYNEELNAILELWKLDFTVEVQGDLFRQPLLQLADELKKRNVSKWLVDTTNQQELTSQDQNWLEAVYYPALYQNGLKIAALVNAKKVMGNIVVKNCLENLGLGISAIDTFNRFQIAKEWLKSQ